MTGAAADVSTLVGDRTVFVEGPLVRAFEKDTLIAAVRTADATRQRIWLESFVASYLDATRGELWWVSGADGWDFLLTVEPDAELQKSAVGVSHWKKGKVVDAGSEDERASGEDAT